MTDAGRDGTTGVRSLAASTDLDDGRRLDVWMTQMIGVEDDPAGWELSIRRPDGGDNDTVAILQLLFDDAGRHNDPFDGLAPESRAGLDAFLTEHDVDRHVVRRLVREAMSGTGWASQGRASTGASGARAPLEATGHDGKIRTFHVQYDGTRNVPGGHVEHVYIVHADAHATTAVFFESAFREVGSSRLRVVMMDHHASRSLAKMGIPEALIRYVHRVTAKAIESSPESGTAADTWRVPAATKYWDRMVAANEAVYDEARDVYTHPGAHRTDERAPS